MGESALETIRKKISVCATELKIWDVTKTQPGTKEIKGLQKRVEELTCAPLSQQNREEFIKVSKELDDGLRRQEIYWAQRSQVSWIKHGDKNTKFFHMKASQ